MIIETKMWICKNCGHKRDTELSICPYCKRDMVLEDKKGTITIMEESEVENHKVSDFTAEPDEKGIYPKRLLTTKEKDTLKTKIQADIEKYSIR